MYNMEKNNFFSPYQSGFRRGRGTMDSIIKLESDIRKALINKETIIAVFFDVEKAYDMLWKEGLLIKLDQIGIGGRIYNWIKEFLIERNIKVKVGDYISREGSIENGTPQVSRIWLPLTTLQLHITHGLQLPSFSALTHSHPPLHQSHSCHQPLINPDCFTTPASHSHTHI